ncbi:MAG: ribosome biogenesis GTP-binding protein YihA/YsxC [Pseudomonadota bacterium]
MVTDTDDTDPAALEKGRLFFAKPWDFWLSVAALDGLPGFNGLEVAFAGRSNVGKSSLINALTGVKGLARTSNTPGRTQQLNYFTPGDPTGAPLAIVDMPGYGYAKAPLPLVEEWNELILAYLKGRANLRRVYVLIDSRHGLKKNDLEVLDLLDKTAVSYQVVLTKIDKIKQAGIARVCDETRDALKKRPAAYPEIMVTSSEKGAGIPELRATIAGLLD